MFTLIGRIFLFYLVEARDILPVLKFCPLFSKLESSQSLCQFITFLLKMGSIFLILQNDDFLNYISDLLNLSFGNYVL